MATKPKSNGKTKPDQEAKATKGSLDEIAQSTSTDALILALKYAGNLVPATSATIGPEDNGNLFVYMSDGGPAVRVSVRNPGFTVDAPVNVDVESLRKALARRRNAKVAISKGVLTVRDAGYKAEIVVEDAAGDFTVQPPSKDSIISQMKMTSDLWAWLQVVSAKLLVIELGLGTEPVFYCRINNKAAVAAALDNYQISFAAVRSDSVGDLPPGGLEFMLPYNFFTRLVKSVPFDGTSLHVTGTSVFLHMRNLRAQLPLTAAESAIQPSDVIGQVQALPKIEGAEVTLDRATLDAFVENANALSATGVRVVTFRKGAKGVLATCKATNGTVEAVVGGSCPTAFAIDLKLLMGFPREGQGSELTMRVAGDGSVAVIRAGGSLPYYYASTLAGDQ